MNQVPSGGSKWVSSRAPFYINIIIIIILGRQKDLCPSQATTAAESWRWWWWWAVGGFESDGWTRRRQKTLPRPISSQELIKGGSGSEGQAAQEGWMGWEQGFGGVGSDYFLEVAPHTAVEESGACWLCGRQATSQAQLRVKEAWPEGSPDQLAEDVFGVCKVSRGPINKCMNQIKICVFLIVFMSWGKSTLSHSVLIIDTL